MDELAELGNGHFASLALTYQWNLSLTMERILSLSIGKGGPGPVLQAALLAANPWCLSMCWKLKAS